MILNLQATDGELSKRLIDFASGLTYALEGGMQKIAEKTFLLTPRNVEVSAEEKARLVEKGFFNQLNPTPLRLRRLGSGAILCGLCWVRGAEHGGGAGSWLGRR